MKTTFATCLIINRHLSHLFSLKKSWSSDIGELLTLKHSKEGPIVSFKNGLQSLIHRKAMNACVDYNDSDVASTPTERYLQISIQLN